MADFKQNNINHKPKANQRDGSFGLYMPKANQKNRPFGLKEPSLWFVVRG